MMGRFPIITAKLERAKKHVEDLNVALIAFWDAEPYVIRFEDDPNTRERTYYVLSVQDLPPEIVTIVGDALHNLRSALDHLAYQLVVAAGGKPDINTAFPIAKSFESYMSPKGRLKVKGMRQDAIKAIDAHKPYKGGNDTLWHLHELNNIEKHRLLITACSTNRARSMTPSERADVTKIFVGSQPNDPIPEFRGMLKAVTPVPLKAGDKLLTVPQYELEQYIHFHFDLLSNEPGVIDRKPLVEALHQMTQLVGKIILEFDVLLK
jgi:hypothetical protein